MAIAKTGLLVGLISGDCEGFSARVRSGRVNIAAQKVRPRGRRVGRVSWPDMLSRVDENWRRLPAAAKTAGRDIASKRMLSPYHAYRNLILRNISPARAQGPVTLNLVTFTPEATFRFSPATGDKFKARWGEGPGQWAHFGYAVPGIPAHCIHEDGVGPWDFGEGARCLWWMVMEGPVPVWRYAAYVRTRPNYGVASYWLVIYRENGTTIANGFGAGSEDYFRADGVEGEPFSFMLTLYGFLGEDVVITGRVEEGAPVWK